MLARLNRQRGKNTERKLAKLLNAKRVGIMGGEDCEHPIFSFEIKSRKSFVAVNWLEQAKRNSKEGKIPVVVVHIRGKRYNQDYVILSLKDWIDLHG